MRNKKYELGKLLYEEPAEIYQKRKKSALFSWIFAIFIFIFAISIKILLDGINISNMNDRMYIILITIVLMFIFAITFYSWIVAVPFQIYENGFRSEDRGIWFYNRIKKIKINYVGYYKDEQPIGIMIFHKRRLLPLIIPFKGDANEVLKTYKAFLKYAVPAIRKSGGKIEFTYDELKRAFEYYNIDTPFLDELKYLFEENKNKNLKYGGGDV